MVPSFSRKVSEAARVANKVSADAWADGIAARCARLRVQGALTYEEMAAALIRQGVLTRRGARWTPQSVYLCCRRARGTGRRQQSRETHELVAGRWRHEMREKILELKRFGATRYADIASTLNREGVTTRLGKPWTSNPCSD